jgi:uncharacterized protein
MKILLSGSHGLIGQGLHKTLITDGHQIITIGRGNADLRWDALQMDPSPALLQDLDVIIHLAGENIAAKRWNSVQKERILRSRVETTHQLSRWAVRFAPSLNCFISASAMGYYGDRGNEVLTEISSPGKEFLSQVCCQWEEASEPVRAAGLRSLQLRLGTVLSADGGALTRILPLFRWGLGGRLGPGSQYFSWIALEDVLRAVQFLLQTPAISGPINLVAPESVTNAQLTSCLAHLVNRPALIPVPAFALKLALGEMAQALLLSSTRVYPEKLLQSGFQYKYPELAGALEVIFSSTVPGHQKL